MVTLVSGRSGVATSCIAAIGGIRDARSAGSSAATTVITRPTANEPITAAAGTPIPARVSPPASLPNRYASSAPTPMPAARPSTEAISPTAIASSTTEPMICRPLAPMARISASSRVRCATMIENVLRIRKMPTSSATAAKPSRILLKKDRPSFRLADASAATCSPVFTSYSVAERAGHVVAQRLVGHPAGGPHGDAAERVRARRASAAAPPAW